jgi:hypothetical protein
VEDTGRHREACVEAKQSREGGVSVLWLYQKLDYFALAWACIVVIRVEIFSSFVRTINRWAWLVAHLDLLTL